MSMDDDDDVDGDGDDTEFSGGSVACITQVSPIILLECLVKHPFYISHDWESTPSDNLHHCKDV